MDFLAAAQKLISIDTCPTQGNAEAVRFLSNLAEGFGFSVHVTEEIVNGLTQANIFIRPKNKKPQKILLQTHLDTVDPGSFGLWNKTGFNPYQASIRGEKIYGLGAADVKLDFLCKLYAMKRARWENLSGEAVLLGTFGEEEQMKGAIRAVRDRFIVPTVTLIGEPTDMDIVYAGKGIAHIEIIIPFPKNSEEEWFNEEVTSSTQSKIFQGRAAHSSVPELGENAIEKMLEYLEKLPENIQVINVDGGISFNTIPTQAALEFDLQSQPSDQRSQQLREIFKTIRKLDQQFKQYPDETFVPPYTTINLGMIRTHQDHIHLSGAVRWSSKIAESQYLSWMKEIANTCKEQKAVFRFLDSKKPYYVDKKTSFAQLCLQNAKKIKPDSEMRTQPLTNEASVFSRFGFECIVFGPGRRENNSHTPEEHVDLADLKKAEDFYLATIEKVCL